MTDEVYYSVQEVAAQRRVTIKTVTRWIQRGVLPGSRKKGPYENSPYEVPKSALDHLDKLQSSN